MLKKSFLLVLLMSILLNESFAQNILISSSNNPSEPSINIDPKHPNVLIAGANLNSCYISKDTGHTWSQQFMYSSYGVWGDPTISVDTNSNFYYFHLSNPSTGNWIDRIVCQKTSNNGISWSDGSYAGLNGKKMQDKQWCAVDRKNNNLYITWTQFDDYNKPDTSYKSNILFSKSTDAGLTWSSPKQINKVSGDCLDMDNTVEGATPAIGPNGEIYVSWAGPNGLVFNQSLDKGETWLKEEIVITSIPGGWDYHIPGIYRCNGLPVTACDLSNGPNRGTIYINWSDQRNGTTNTDVWIVKSQDGGATWSAPRKVNDDNSNRHQFLTWMALDQTDGHLYFVFYDRRHYSSDSTDVYVAESIDGGNHFINHLISETPFLPDPNVFFGDYNNIIAHNGIVRPIWTRLNNGKLSQWTDIRSYDQGAITSVRTPVTDMSFENYPNPSDHMTYVSFKLHTESNVNLTILDIQGKEVAKIITNEKRTFGKYIEPINLDALHIPTGLYFLKLTINNEVRIIRQVKI